LPFLQYYSLDISFFKSSLDGHLLDLLWNKYWVRPAGRLLHSILPGCGGALHVLRVLS